MEPILYYGKPRNDINEMVDNTWRLKPRPCKMCDRLVQGQLIRYEIQDGVVQDGRCNMCKKVCKK